MNLTSAFVIIFGAIFLALGIGLVFSYPIMLLWNNCAVPAISGFHEIGWLQAWGLSVLFTCLFKTTPSTKSSD